MRYDGEDLIIEMNDNDSIIASYTFGPGIDQPFMMNRNNNNYYYLADGLGSITGITDSIGNVLQEYKYSVFGEIVEQTADSIENSFTFTGRELESETGLYYYRKRYYNPKMGRFISEDPARLGGWDQNFYRYVWNDPLNWIDPFGLQGSHKSSLLELHGIKTLQELQGPSLKWDYEYSSNIFKNPMTGKYGHTDPYTEEKKHLVGDAPFKDNIYQKKEAEAHTHGRESPGYDDEHFSEDDKKSNYIQFLITPSGKILQYDPNTGEIWMYNPKTKEWESQLGDPHEVCG